MALTFKDRLSHAWNAFHDTERSTDWSYASGVSYFRPPDRVRLTGGNERSIVAYVYNRIALDCASLTIQHVRLDENDRYSETIKDGLNNCLTLEANIDQSAKAFIQDAVLSMFDEGYIAIVPIDTTLNKNTGSYDIKTMRVGKIVEWFPAHIRVRLYDDSDGQFKERIFPKRTTAVIENPFYAVMNEPNSTGKRLLRKLNIMDFLDEKISSNKLDLIIQLPYVVKSPLQKEQAEKRRRDIENQLVGSPYGIAYIDGTEKITQLGHPVENTMLSQVEFLTKEFLNQLSITEEILNGTASEEVMNNYFERTIFPTVGAVIDAMKRSFLTKTARTQGQSIMVFQDPFRYVSAASISEIADKFTRNEIMTSNEVRQIVGMKPSKDPKADELRNKNLNQSNEEIAQKSDETPEDEPFE